MTGLALSPLFPTLGKSSPAGPEDAAEQLDAPKILDEVTRRYSMVQHDGKTILLDTQQGETWVLEEVDNELRWRPIPKIDNDSKIEQVPNRDLVEPRRDAVADAPVRRPGVVPNGHVPEGDISLPKDPVAADSKDEKEDEIDEEDPDFFDAEDMGQHRPRPAAKRPQQPVNRQGGAVRRPKPMGEAYKNFLRQRIFESQVERNRLLERLGRDHPSVRKVDAVIAEAQDQLDGSVPRL